MFIAFIRIVKSGAKSFWRNRWVSSATIGVMSLALLIISSVLLMSMVAEVVISSIEKKVDISVYFKPETSEKKILAVRDELLNLQEVGEVEYISRNKALVQFRKLHSNDPLIQESLQELGENPLRASLNIQAKNPKFYENIAQFLNAPTYANLIEKINYLEHKQAIESLNRFTSAARRAGVGVSLVLILIASLVTFNTIRLTIYNARERISIMRLVGSNNWFIRGPFLVEGALYGIVAAIITLLFLYVALSFLGPRWEPYFRGLNEGVNLFAYFRANLGQFLLLQLGVGAVLGVLSSFIAIRRYLRI